MTDDTLRARDEAARLVASRQVSMVWLPGAILALSTTADAGEPAVDGGVPLDEPVADGGVPIKPDGALGGLVGLIALLALSGT